MKQFFITGTSSGIGRALTKQALEDGHHVIGISRRASIEHPNYRHLSIDLSDYGNYHLLNFNVNKDAEEVVLINNAGWLGEVKPAGKIKPESILRTYQINLIAPSILCKLFIEQTERVHTYRAIVNISSGAGRRAVPSWSTYCASKAGLELFTRVLRMDHPDIRSYSIAPGIVDTEMQGELRQVAKEYFPDKKRYVEFKEKGELVKPEEVARKILSIIYKPELAPDYVFSLRDFKL